MRSFQQSLRVHTVAGSQRVMGRIEYWRGAHPTLKFIVLVGGDSH